MSNFQALLTNLDELGLQRIKSYLPEYIDQINEQQLSFTTAMLKLTELEINYQNQLHTQKKIKRARFPQQKSLKNFDFEFQPTINRQEIVGFKDLAFIAGFKIEVQHLND